GAATDKALGAYYWSRGTREGFFVGGNLPALQEGQVFQVWLMTGDGAIPIAAFKSSDGSGQAYMDLAALKQRPEGIGVSVESAAGAAQPTGDLVLFAAMPSR
ncbi:MAG TPA: anti-sigma factor, partial [Dehalococcoidia bacterium]|nr:anti-sigma factor [Dehalococcoidia bacterium]